MGEWVSEWVGVAGQCLTCSLSPLLTFSWTRAGWRVGVARGGGFATGSGRADWKVGVTRADGKVGVAGDAGFPTGSGGG